MIFIEMHRSMNVKSEMNSQRPVDMNYPRISPGELQEELNPGRLTSAPRNKPMTFTKEKHI
jgi:hypothetical protein